MVGSLACSRLAMGMALIPRGCKQFLQLGRGAKQERTMWLQFHFLPWLLSRICRACD